MIACPNSTRMYDSGVDTENLITAEQVAELLGIKRRSVYHMTRHLNGFPQPAVTFVRTPMWERKQIEDWRKAHPARHPQKR